MSDLCVNQGDFGYTLTFTIQTATGGDVDLTGKTAVTFKVWKPLKPFVTIVSATTTIVTASTGICSYAPASTDFLTKGLYNMEIEYADAVSVDSTKTYILEVLESP